MFHWSPLTTTMVFGQHNNINQSCPFIVHTFLAMDLFQNSCFKGECLPSQSHRLRAFCPEEHYKLRKCTLRQGLNLIGTLPKHKFGKTPIEKLKFSVPYQYQTYSFCLPIVVHSCHTNWEPVAKPTSHSCAPAFFPFWAMNPTVGAFSCCVSDICLRHHCLGTAGPWSRCSSSFALRRTCWFCLVAITTDWQIDRL